MPSWPDHALALVLVFFFPLRAATFGYRRLTTAPDDQIESIRRSLYLQAIGFQWMLAAVALGLWVAYRRDFVELGLVPRNLLGLAAGLVLAAGFGFGLWKIRRSARERPETLDLYLEKLEHLERMLPHSRSELRTFQIVSVTAGFCEELLYRGYLFWYFASWLGPWSAVAVASAIFGLGHAYQGWKGILTTALVGAVMAGLYLGTGSLWPAMACHALTDMHAGTLALAALSRRDSAPLETPAEGSADEPITPDALPPQTP